MYAAAYWVVGELRHSPHVAPNYVAAAMVTWVFTLVSRTWFLRKSLGWTPLRARQTTLAALLTGGVAAAGALHGLRAYSDLGLLLGGIGPPLLWILSTAWIWRESDEERIKRVLAAGGPTVVCPDCGYDLRGLRATRCPECGAEHTLDELFAFQHRPATRPRACRRGSQGMTPAGLSGTFSGELVPSPSSGF